MTQYFLTPACSDGRAAQRYCVLVHLAALDQREVPKVSRTAGSALGAIDDDKRTISVAPRSTGRTATLERRRSPSRFARQHVFIAGSVDADRRTTHGRRHGAIDLDHSRSSLKIAQHSFTSPCSAHNRRDTRLRCRALGGEIAVRSRTSERLARRTRSALLTHAQQSLLDCVTGKLQFARRAAARGAEAACAVHTSYRRQR